MIKAGIIGATGYVGAECYRILLTHKKIGEIFISSVSYEGQNIADIFSNFSKVGEQTLLSSDEVIEKSDVIFASLPHGYSEEFAKKANAKNKVFIDLGADFRLDSEAEYKKWYECDYNEKELHKKAVYGLPELNKEQIKNSKIIGNPGCYPTSIALGLYPLISKGLCTATNIMVDSKSGTTGAGRGLGQTTHHPDCNEAFSPYKVGAHRHTPEIEQTLSKMAGENVKITFVPHLLPINRGIISTIYADRNCEESIDELIEIYKDFYKDEPFVRIKKKGEVANLKWVKMSNYCDISIHEDSHTKKIIIVSAIDNMVKGAAGQAIQNMNLIFGFDEAEGLTLVPPAF